jgi:hypothetical protein
VCDVKARGRALSVMSAGVGAVSVRPVELCLWGVRRGAGCDAGKRRAMRRIAGAGLVEAGSPTPRGTRCAPPRAAVLLRPEDDSASSAPLHRSYHDHHWGVVQHPTDTPHGVDVRLDRGAKYLPDFHSYMEAQECKRCVGKYVACSCHGYCGCVAGCRRNAHHAPRAAGESPLEFQ